MYDIQFTVLVSMHTDNLPKAVSNIQETVVLCRRRMTYDASTRGGYGKINGKFTVLLQLGVELY